MILSNTPPCLAGPSSFNPPIILAVSAAFARREARMGRTLHLSLTNCEPLVRKESVKRRAIRQMKRMKRDGDPDGVAKAV